MAPPTASPAPQPSEGQDPHFFLSYARTPSMKDGRRLDHPDKELEDFHWELCRNLMQLTDRDGSGPPGFLDQRMGIGKEWERTLKQALATCQVFVPVYARRYFTREWCGKEWDAFARRQAAQRGTRPYTVNAIVPVLWTSPADLELPPVAEAVQYSHPDLGQAYLKRGLYGLLKDGYWLQYRRAVWGISQTIVNVARQARLDPCDIELFDDLRNVFDEGA
ncbi:TIR-like protein FxsC [Streptomyces sp. NPDC054863]